MKRTFLALCILFLATQRSTNGQSDDKTDCSKMDFTDIPKDCCKSPFATVFPPEKLAAQFKECKSNPKVLEWANSYKLNTLQQQDIKNFIDLENANTKKELCAAGAFMECLFKSKEWIDANGVLNTPLLWQTIKADANSTEWKTVVDKTIIPFSPGYPYYYSFLDILEDKFEKITCTTGNVNLAPLMFAQMLQSEFIWMCPQQEIYTTKNKCAETMRNYHFCDGKIYSNLAKGVFFFAST